MFSWWFSAGIFFVCLCLCCTSTHHSPLQRLHPTVQTSHVLPGCGHNMMSWIQQLTVHIHFTNSNFANSTYTLFKMNYLLYCSYARHSLPKFISMITPTSLFCEPSWWCTTAAFLYQQQTVAIGEAIAKDRCVQYSPSILAHGTVFYATLNVCNTVYNSLLQNQRRQE